jgi:O-antigen biosynthesis protein
VPKDGAAFQSAREIGRGNGVPGDGVDLKEARGEQNQADILQRLDRLVANQKELDARLWTLEDSRVFRILQRIGSLCSLVKERTARLVSPGALAREKHRRYQLWLEGQQSREMDVGEFSYRPIFKVITVGEEPAASLNRMVEESASDYLVFLSPKSNLASNALFELAAELQHDRFEVLYADEDHVSASGERKDPIFKPEWSPELSFSPLYLGRFLVVSTITFQAAGGFREGAQGAYLFDLALRLTAQPVRFHRVPRILVSTEEDRTSPGSERLALEHFIAEHGLEATVEPSEHGFAIRRKVQGSPLVSIVICSRRALLLKKCLDAIDRTTAYPHRETVIVEHMAEDKSKLDRLLSDSRCTRVSYSGRFDFAAMNNLAAKEAKGDIIVLLNDDARPLCSSWLEAMVAQVQRPEVGVVGALLLYPSGAIQHSGIAVGLMGAVGHPGRGTLDGGFWPWAAVTRNVSAVTGACIAIRREVFEELGGFDAQFPVNFNDVDLCLRAREAGYEVILEAGARLCHIESGTRPLGVAWEERELFAKRWSAQIGRRDPYYSPHLTVSSEDCSLASST